jgi:uncharacterized protein (UPF0276 family)
MIHGLSGNVASITGPEDDYLELVRRLADHIDAYAYSDHLAFTAVRGRSLGHLAPNLFDDELLEAAAGHIRRIGALTGRRVCLENLATATMLSGSTYSPEEFYLRLLESCDEWDCLFDLTNVWINSQNRPLDPVAVIDAIPLGRVRCVHLAGGEWMHGELVDTHSTKVHPEAIELLDHLLERQSPEVIIIERDSKFEGALEEVRADLAAVTDLVRRHEQRRAHPTLARPA